MGIKNFMQRKLLERQLKSMPAGQREKFIAAFEANPKLFETIAKEIEHKTKKEGKGQQAAAMEVMRAHQAELQKAFMDVDQKQ